MPPILGRRGGRDAGRPGNAPAWRAIGCGEWAKKSPLSSKLGRGRGLLSYRPPVFVLGRRRLFGWARARAELSHHTIVADAKSILWPICAFDAPPTRLRWPRRGRPGRHLGDFVASRSRSRAIACEHREHRGETVHSTGDRNNGREPAVGLLCGAAGTVPASGSQCSPTSVGSRLRHPTPGAGTMCVCTSQHPGQVNPLIKLGGLLDVRHAPNSARCANGRHRVASLSRSSPLERNRRDLRASCRGDPRADRRDHRRDGAVWERAVQNSSPSPRSASSHRCSS